MFLFGRKNVTINNEQTRVGAVAIQNSAQGVTIPIVYGTTRITGNTIWYGDFTAIPNTTSETSGGGCCGGGKTTVTTTTYTYTVGIAIGLCEGPIVGVGQVWEQKNIESEATLGLTEFLGDYAQVAWTYLTSNHPTEAFGYRGLAYEASAAFQLGSSASLPNLSFEVNGVGLDYAQKVLCHFDGADNATTTVDVLGHAVTLAGSGKLSTSAAKFGASSLYGDSGVASYNICRVSGLDSNTFSQSTGWTIECFVYYTALVGNAWNPTTITSYSAGAGVGVQLVVYPNSAGFPAQSLRLALFGDGPTTIANYVVTALPGAVTLNAWHHVAVTYDPTAGHYYTYFDGVVVHDVTSAVLVRNDTDYIKINPSEFSGVSFINYVDEFLVTRGCKYHGGTPFTPSTIPFVTSFVSNDINPADVLTGLLTNANYGAAFPSAQMGNMTAFSNYCTAAGFLVSPAYIAQRPAMELAAELLAIGNSAPFWSEGVLKVTPYADANVGTFVPVTTVNYQLTDDDFLTAEGEDPIRVLRKRPADAFNSVSVQCKDRANNYNNYVAAADDQAAIDLYGLRAMPMVTLDAICLPAVGRLVAQTMLQRVLYYLNTYEFTVGWKYSRLEPMDLVGLTDTGLGLSATTVRILSVEEDEDGALRMTAENFNAGVSNPATYTAQAASGYIVNQAVSGGNSSTPVIFQPPPSLTGAGTSQIWLGTSGGAGWGGAEVWGSSDNATYTKIGLVTAPARHGVLTANLPTHVDPDGVSTLAVNLTVSLGALLTVPTAQADALDTVSYVDGELLAYANVSLTSAYNYNVTYLRRGSYGSTIGAHLTGTKFMRLDGAVVKININDSWVGSTLYVKLPSFNTTGGGLQALADVAATTFVVATPTPTIIDGGSP